MEGSSRQTSLNKREANMVMTNAEKQRRWREKRNRRADALSGKPKEIADNLLF
jgi:hypothetical protein